MFFGLDWLSVLISTSFKVVFAIVSGLVFWLCWTSNGIGSTYFYFLPEVYHSIPYLKIVGLFLVIGYLGELVAKLTPKLVSVNNSSTNS